MNSVFQGWKDILMGSFCCTVSSLPQSLSQVLHIIFEEKVDSKNYVSIRAENVSDTLQRRGRIPNSY